MTITQSKSVSPLLPRRKPWAISKLLRVALLASVPLAIAFTCEANQAVVNTISSADLTLHITMDGKVAGRSPAGTFSLRTDAEGCGGNMAQIRPLADGAVEVIRDLDGPSGQSCRIRDRFAPTANSIRWTVSIESEGEAWTTPVKMSLIFDKPEGMEQWRPGLGSDQPGWRDPLETGPPTEGTWVYGRYQGLSLPMASMLRAQDDAAVSLIASPDQLLLGLDIHTMTNGIAIMHSDHRFGSEHTAVFAADLVAHPADARGALGWITTRYAEYFDPPVTDVHRMAGCGAYSAFLEVPDVERMKKMAFRINWNAYFDWPYLGMNLPPMPDGDTPWICCDPYRNGLRREMTYNRLNNYGRRMREAGFFALNYFTTTEFGTFMKGADAVDYDLPEEYLWKDCNSYAFRKIKDGILFSGSGNPVDNNWKNGYGMDCGGPDYRAFLIEQAHRQVKWLPDFDGICIDRLDWLNQVNRLGDDGVGLYMGKPGRLVRIGWLDLMDEMAPIFHNEGKVIFANPCSSYRMEVGRYLDDIYDEFGHVPVRLNASAMLCLRKPLMAWTPSKSVIADEPDAYFQRHLYLGAYPTAPYPLNNHTITPDSWAEEQFFAYGPLMDAYRGRKWVLTPHCVDVQDDQAKVNLFEVPGGWVIPVTFAVEGDKTVTVRVRRVEGLGNNLKIDALLPATEQPQFVATAMRDTELELQVPVHRGCAMVRLQQLEN